MNVSSLCKCLMHFVIIKCDIVPKAVDIRLYMSVCYFPICPVKPRHLRYIHYCWNFNDQQNVKLAWRLGTFPDHMVGLHPLSDLGCIIQNRYELQSQRILGVDRKGWVPVPHPGYHYILKNIYGNCPFHQFRFKNLNTSSLGLGGEQQFKTRL